ncbi:hypothetical protein [Bacillus sp. FJAT-49736]|uniref:hypothetical protein n=1 Tax=Bacillus sp. FJAT-49736 TaxID=2833582 RepID=UPI001BC92677|nr:hypothetical protein [Bacillus sp. FJAT-49736]MBS4174537.1 hypothetical protein [Bacillus sp. FJAT-49736]
METIDFLTFKEDWTFIKRMIISVTAQLEDNQNYAREQAIDDLVDVIQEMDKREPKKEREKTKISID